MKEITPTFLLILLLLITSCDTTNHNFPEEYAPGEVLVKFADDVTQAEAEKLILDLSLVPIDLSDLDVEKHPNWTTIGVPEGQEKIWVQKFKSYSMVITAELNAINRPLLP